MERPDLEYRFLKAHAKNLAILCLQSDRYDADSEYAEVVDQVLLLTMDVTRVLPASRRTPQRVLNFNPLLDYINRGE